MISSARNFKYIIQKLNILGQKQTIQPVPVVLDCLGHFVLLVLILSIAHLLSRYPTSSSQLSPLVHLLSLGHLLP